MQAPGKRLAVLLQVGHLTILGIGDSHRDAGLPNAGTVSSCSLRVVLTGARPPVCSMIRKPLVSNLGTQQDYRALAAQTGKAASQVLSFAQARAAEAKVLKPHSDQMALPRICQFITTVSSFVRSLKAGTEEGRCGLAVSVGIAASVGLAMSELGI